MDHAPHTVFDIEPGELSNILFFDAFELTHAWPHSVWSKEVAPQNILNMLVTCDTSHLDRSALNELAPPNIQRM